jgi:gluconolactonase
VKVASEVRWPKTTQAPPPVDVEWCSVPDDLEIVAEGLDFPEGPIACADGTLLVVEVRGGRLMRVFPTGGLEIVADLGGGPNGAALGPDGAIYICNNGGLPWSQLDDGSWYPVDRRTGSMTPAGYAGGWIERVDPSSGDITRLIERVDGTVLSAPNDIAFDRAGDLWFTDTGKTGIGSTVLGAVYRARADGSEVERFATGLLGPNGIGFAPTADRVYVSDTPSGRLFEWDVRTGEAFRPSPIRTAGRVRARMPGAIALDSLAVDAEDRIVVAMPGSGGLAVVQPDGGMWFVRMPDPLPTNVCFGGDDRQTAFVTLGGHGRLVRFRWPCPGAPVYFAD